MSEQFWHRLSLIAGYFAIIVFFGTVTFATGIEVKDFDLWLHLKMGRYILEHGFVPGYDVLSCTIAGKPWVNHEWLFQVFIYSLHFMYGFDGLITMQTVLVTLTMGILLLIGYNRDRQILVVFLLIQVLLIYQMRFTIRPDLFSLFFFTIYMYILSSALDRRWSVFVLFVVQVLWSNMHGFFFFGPVLVTVAIFSELVKRRIPLPYEWNQVGRLTDEEFRRLLTIGVFTILACLVNPLTFEGAIYPIRVIFQLTGESKIFFDHIQELAKPFQGWNIFSPDVFPYYKILIIVSLVSFMYNRRKIDISVLIFWLAFLGFSLIAIRNLVFFALASYLVIMVNSLSLKAEDVCPIRFESPVFKSISGIVVKVLLILWMMSFNTKMANHGYFDFDTYQRKSEFGGLSKRNFPYKAADFLVQNKIKGNFFNDFNSGAYLVGRTHPNIKVFIDGRTEVYGSEFFKTYQQVWKKGNKEVFDQLQERFNITGAFLNSVRDDIPSPVLKMFYDDKEWVCVYFDYDAVIFLKRVPEHAETIEKFKVDLENWQPIELDIFKIGTKPIIPLPNANRAFSLKSMGLYEPAKKEAELAIKIAPHFIDPYKVLGDIYGNEGDYLKSYENYRIASVLSSNDLKIRKNLAQSLMDLGRYQDAVYQYNRIINAFPDDPHAYFAISKTYTLADQYDMALKFLKLGHKLDPDDISDVIIIGDLLNEREAYDEAFEAYTMALEGNSQPAPVYRHLGDIEKKRGNAEKAEEYYNKAKSAETSGGQTLSNSTNE